MKMRIKHLLLATMLPLAAFASNAMAVDQLGYDFTTVVDTDGCENNGTPAQCLGATVGADDTNNSPILVVAQLVFKDGNAPKNSKAFTLMFPKNTTPINSPTLTVVAPVIQHGNGLFSVYVKPDKNWVAGNYVGTMYAPKGGALQNYQGQAMVVFTIPTAAVASQSNVKPIQ
jgi:hypothetical protein